MRHLVFPMQCNEEGEPLLIHSIQRNENEEGMPSRPLLSTRRQQGYDPPCPLLVLPLQCNPTRVRPSSSPPFNATQRGGSLLIPCFQHDNEEGRTLLVPSFQCDPMRRSHFLRKWRGHAPRRIVLCI